MKRVFLLLNLILVPISYFGYRYYENTPKRGDYSNYAIKKDSGKSTILQVVPDEAAISSKEVDEVIDALPFDPKRCGEPKEQEKKNFPTAPARPRNLNLKLVGIFQMGERSGAIIIDNSNHHAAPRQRTSRTRHVRRPTHTPTPPQKQEANKSSYYRIGDKLPCGYNVKEIKKESVLLVQGSNSFDLKLEAAVVVAATAPALPEKRIIGVAGGVAKNSTASSNRLNHNKNINNKGHRR